MVWELLTCPGDQNFLGGAEKAGGENTKASESEILEWSPVVCIFERFQAIDVLKCEAELVVYQQGCASQ